MFFEEEKKYFILALSLHFLMLMLLFLGGQVFLGNKPIKIKASKVNILESAVRIDVVGMPKHTLKELEKMDLVNTKNVKESKVDSSNETSKIEFKKAQKKISMKDLLSKYSSKKVVKPKQKKKIKKTNINLKQIILEGNKLSKGSSTTGKAIKESEQIFSQYVGALPSKIKPFWKLPTYLLEKKLRCRLQVFVGKNGEVLRVEIYESSGEPEYDKKAKAALMAASPLPVPEESIYPRLVKGEVLLGFPL